MKEIADIAEIILEAGVELMLAWLILIPFLWNRDIWARRATKIFVGGTALLFAVGLGMTFGLGFVRHLYLLMAR